MLLDRLGLARNLILIALLLIAPGGLRQVAVPLPAGRPDRLRRQGAHRGARAGPRRQAALRPRARPPAVRPRRRRRPHRRQRLAAATAAVKRSSAALEAVDREVGDQLGNRADWKRLEKSIDAMIAAPPTVAALAVESYGRLTEATLRLIVRAGDTSNLILDPDLESCYVMDALVNKVPAALDAAGRVSSREVALVAAGDSTEADRILLAIDQGEVNMS